MDPTEWIIVPCFNEAQRLDTAEFLRFLDSVSTARLLFVNDGSVDETASLLRTLEKRAPSRISVLELPENRGKAEAVRRGLRHALDQGANIVGYLDADLATPVDEAARLLTKMRSSSWEILLAARVALLGRDIARTASRHYLGRVFASLASGILRLPVYDTQCGAKFFRASAALSNALDRPFISRWAFDVELLGRMTSGREAIDPTRIVEEPLLVWHDVANSKLGLLQMGRAGLDLVRIAWSLRRR